MATRPHSGARPPDAPDHAACLNCGGPLQGAYCHACGQAAADPIGPIGVVVREAAEAFLDLDRRLLVTARSLLLRPAFLTQEYVSGRRRRWVSPFRVYLVTSVLYFLVQQWGGAGRLLYIDTDSPVLARALEVWLPRLMFAIVPLFAALVAALFRRPRRTYVEHLVFTLHVQSAWFVLLTVDALLRLALAAAAPSTPLRVVGGAMLIGVNVLVWVYLWLALRRFFSYGRPGTGWRFLALLLGYGALLAAASVGLLVLVAPG